MESNTQNTDHSGYLTTTSTTFRLLQAKDMKSYSFANRPTSALAVFETVEKIISLGDFNFADDIEGMC